MRSFPAGGRWKKGEPQRSPRTQRKAWAFVKAKQAISCHPARIRRPAEEMRGLLLKFLASSTEGDAALK